MDLSELKKLFAINKSWTLFKLNKRLDLHFDIICNYIFVSYKNKHDNDHLREMRSIFLMEIGKI